MAEATTAKGGPKNCSDSADVAALDPDKLERLGRYEVHLEWMLATLLRLKDLRQGTVAG